MFQTDRVVIVPEWRARLAALGMDSVEAVYGLTEGTVITRSSSTEVRRMVCGKGLEARTVFLKKYWVEHPRQLWSGLCRGTFFGRSKVRREFENLARLRAWGLDAPAPVAYGEMRRGRWLLRSFLMSEGVPDPVPLDVFIRDYLPRLPSAVAQRQRRELIERLADYTRRMHERRFVHHDYFWRNILLSGGQLDHFSLIDAHKGHVWWPGQGEFIRARDLAALDAPAPRFFRRAERLRFFLRYLGAEKLGWRGRSLLRRSLRLAEPQRSRQYQRVEQARYDGGRAAAPPVVQSGAS
ncbi:MAG TPA: lipopolysaccharide kinase InaA family protein [Methylomirabilota bacterium]|nr:lipopolysaccharide kinase InaA family protein [Methylomirabilota bacterium]